jgi:hypothetical protein
LHCLLEKRGSAIKSRLPEGLAFAVSKPAVLAVHSRPNLSRSVIKPLFHRSLLSVVSEPDKAAATERAAGVLDGHGEIGESPVTKCLVIVLVAGCVRYANIVRNKLWQDPLAESGHHEEVFLAQSLAAGEGYISPFRDANEFRNSASAHSPPGYPFLLAGIIRGTALISSERILPYRIALVFSIDAGSASATLIALVVGRVRGRIGFWTAGLFGSFCPSLVNTSGLLWDTSFFVLGVAALRWTCVFGIGVLPWPFYVTHVYSRYRASVDAIIITLGAICVARLINRIAVCGSQFRRRLPP